jgi:hypothetical protein
MEICCFFILAIIKLETALKHKNKHMLQRVIATIPTCLTPKTEILWHSEQKAVPLAILCPLGACEKFWIHTYT